VITPDDNPELYDEAIAAYFAWHEERGGRGDLPTRDCCEIGARYVWISNNYRLLAKYDHLEKKIIIEADSWVSTTQAGELLGLSRQRVIQLLQAGELEGQKLNPRALMVSRDSVERLKDARSAERGEKSEDPQ
jgi:hypothetical protein